LLLIVLVALAVIALSFLFWPNGSFPIGRSGGSVVHPTIKGSSDA
jgi:hypothetical protein